MDFNKLSPYVRLAWTCGCYAPFTIEKRIIFDYELIYIEKGKWLLEINNQQIICSEGNFILIRPGVEHCMKSIGNIDVQQPHIHFDFIYSPKSKERYINFTTIEKLPDKDKELITHDIFKNKKLPVCFSPNNSEIWKNLLYDIIELYKQKSSYIHSIIREKMLALCHLILIEYGEISQNERTIFNNIMFTIKDYIDNYHLFDHSTRLTLDILENHFHINKFYIDKIFKKTFGVSVIKYYNTKTISYANIYLMQNKSIQEISDTLKFTSIFVFSRFYKNNTGISPMSYKNINKESK